VLAYVRAAEAAFNARDWEGLKSLAAPEMINVDHRPFGSGPQGPESGQLHALVDAIPDATWRHEPIEVLSPQRALLRLEVKGRGVDGGPVEIHLARLVEVGAAGICTRNDVFEDEAAARAWLAAAY
jgi:SnoaL-like domain